MQAKHFKTNGSIARGQDDNPQNGSDDLRAKAERLKGVEDEHIAEFDADIDETDDHERDGRITHARVAFISSPVIDSSTDMLTQSAPENSELYDWYLLVQSLLQNSIFEMKRGTGARLEPEFWRSRYADFFIDQFNCMREQMGMDTISARTLRIGIARKFDQPDNWLLPDDNLTEDEIAAVCGQYALMWRRIHAENPNGIDDPTSNYLFTPNINPKPSRAEEAKSTLQDPPKPRAEPEPSLEQTLQSIRPMRAANTDSRSNLHSIAQRDPMH